ncbi:RIP metalloprotease RseP [Paracoccaceae bacterium GXU_MW_L88]
MEFLTSIPLIGTLLPFVFVLSIVVAIHEYGHYIVGRWCGIHAEVFSIGFGKVLWSRVDSRGTRWQIAALPLGGYVKFLGDADATSRADAATTAAVRAEDQARSFPHASLLARALTVVAGPVANFILSAVIFTALAFWVGQAKEGTEIGALVEIPGVESGLQVGDEILAVGGQEVASLGEVFAVELPDAASVDYLIRRDGDTLTVPGPMPFPPLVGGVQPYSPAANAGLEEGDVIRAINGETIWGFNALRETVEPSVGQELDLTVLRGAEEITLTLVPEEMDSQTADGFEKRVMIGVFGAPVMSPVTETPGLFTAMGRGVERVWFVISSSIAGLIGILGGQVSADNLQGPLGIADFSRQAAEGGWLQLVSLIGVISTAIGLMNLFPIPVLDGGHLMLYLAEWLRGKPLPAKAVNFMMTVGMSLLLLLMLFATYNDIMRQFSS